MVRKGSMFVVCTISMVLGMVLLISKMQKKKKIFYFVFDKPDLYLIQDLI